MANSDNVVDSDGGSTRRLISNVLSGIEIEPLPDGSHPTELLAFIKLEESDGGTGWSVRVTQDLDEEEILGVLVGYVSHLQRRAADSWNSDVVL